MSRTTKLRFACVQVNPRIGSVDANISKVRSLLKDVKEADFVILPELAITGYNFANKASIEPYLEEAEEGKGPSITLAKEISNRLKCFTLIGYPEIFQSKIYNSAILISPAGEVLYNYRKTFLYETDETWGASENPEKGFKSFNLVVDKEFYLSPSEKSYPTVKTNIGICMDLNPYKFEAPFNDFEFSLAAFAQRSKLILVPTAWLSPQSPSSNTLLSTEEKAKEGKAYEELYFGEENSPISSGVQFKGSEAVKPFDPSGFDASTINYWILRFFPFLRHPNSIQDKYFEKATVVMCNRVGVENDIMYAGSSSIFQFLGKESISNEIDSKNPSVNVIGSLGKGEVGVLIRDIDVEVD
ncbi:carbon-nitrogen hydrolase [Scheffersomyces xylosifermentans]|uniref:carbon-nitrogen hydrolase n=1 Tax=Scheffersomyces xylosifermentans TaxID=1304137 RepID=UPI00315CA06E